MRMRWFGVLIALSAIGCGNEEPRAQALPPDANAGGTGGVGGFLGGGGNRDEDGGEAPRDAAADADTPFMSGFALGECVDETDLPSATNQVFMPSDFPVTRGFAHWIGTCGDPVLQIGLSNGNCPNGGGHELVIEIDADAIGDGTLFIPGGNQVSEERPDRPIRIRYVRPTSLTPAGTWGTCAGVFGEIIVEALDVTDDAALRAELGLTLAACNTSTTPTTFALVGSFNLKLERGLSEVCPR